MLMLISFESSHFSGGVFILLLLLEFLKLFASFKLLLELKDVFIGDMGISSIFSRSCATLADWCLWSFVEIRLEPDEPGRLDDDMSGWYTDLVMELEVNFDESTRDEIVSRVECFCIDKSSLSKLNCRRSSLLEPGFPVSSSLGFGLRLDDLSCTGIERFVSLGLKHR